MMHERTMRFETESSVWKIDLDAKLAFRFPKSERPEHPNVAYEPEPYTFESVEPVWHPRGWRLKFRGGSCEDGRDGPLATGASKDWPADGPAPEIPAD